MFIVEILGDHDCYRQDFGIRDFSQEMAAVVQRAHHVVNDDIARYNQSVVHVGLGFE